MCKIRINSRIRAIFLVIIGIFSINSVKVHGDYHFLNNRGFIHILYDEKERQVFKKLYDYMDTTHWSYRRYQIEELLPEEFKKMSEKKKTGIMYAVSKRGFKYAFGEVLHKVMPAFPLDDEEAVKLASIYLGVRPEDILDAAFRNRAQYMACDGYGYSDYNTIFRKISKSSRFYFIDLRTYLETVYRDR